MIELLSALVANGTTFGSWGYEPWLPFDNFIPISILAAIIFWFITRNRLLSVMFLVSEYSSLIPTSVLYFEWDLNLWGVFGVWGLNTVIIWLGQIWLLDYLARLGAVIKEVDKESRLTRDEKGEIS